MSQACDWDQLWLGMSVASMDPDRPEPYGAIAEAAIAVTGGRISWIGQQQNLPHGPDAARQAGTTVCEIGGGWVTPGLIDCHTHLVYGGNRAGEFEARLLGESYEAIARRGGGILSTVTATRSASEDELFTAAASRLQAFLHEGVTGIEIKSGYGLDRDNEVKMLAVARRLGAVFPVDVATTFLGAHTLPPEYSDADAYIDWLCAELMPELAGLGLIDAVDVFCESIAFNPDQAGRVMEAARNLGLPVKAHVEQLSNMGGSIIAARHGALSVDHLEYLDVPGIDAIADSGTVAVLLPGAFYYLKETRLPPVARLRRAGVPIAVASDHNPGSSPVFSLLLAMNLGCTLFGLTPEEVLAGGTRNAARALGWQGDRGILREGYLADFVVWDVNAPAEIVYGMGHNPCVTVVKAGERVLDRNR